MRKIDKFLKLEPGFPVFRQAIPAIYWPALGWLEWHFAFFATVGTGYFRHFSWTGVPWAAIVSGAAKIV